MKAIRCLLGLCVMAAPFTSLAQSNSTQLWAEYMVNYPFANSWNLELASSYSTQFESPTWKSFDLQVTPEYSITPHIDVLGALYAAKTFQYQSLSSTELRETLGARIHFTPNRRVLTRLLVRYEFRRLYHEETETTENSQRLRVRAESLFPLNRPTMYEDKLLYGVADIEAFFVAGQNVSERYANRFRVRLALGYRMSYSWRFELMYTLQQSRNTIAGDFTTNDNIIRLRVKHFLRKSKPSPVQGNGN